MFIIYYSFLLGIDLGWLLISLSVQSRALIIHDFGSC